MIHKLVTTIVLILSAAALNAYGFGLGNIEVSSVLNQPINGKITLHKVSSYTANDIVTTLASKDAFEKAGVERAFFLNSFHFKTVINQQGDSYIQISSDAPIQEPFVDFLVTVQWPNGKMIREFTVLIDPPSPSQDTDITSTKAIKSNKAFTTQAQGNTKKAAAHPSVQPAKETLPNTSSTPIEQPDNPMAATYHVEPRDHLWRIVHRINAPVQYTPNQVMLAILHKNPNAFTQDNINQLKANTTLNLPSPREIAAIDPQTARQRILEQNHAFQQRIIDIRKPDDSHTVAKPKVMQDRLEIVGDGTNTQTTGKVDSDSNNAKHMDLALKNQLAASLADNDRLRRENADLQSHLKDIQQQINTLEKLVTLKNDQLTQLQAQVTDLDSRDKNKTDTPPADHQNQEGIAASKENRQPPSTTPPSADTAPKPDTAPKSTAIQSAVDRAKPNSDQQKSTPEPVTTKSEPNKVPALIITPPPKASTVDLVVSWLKNPMLPIGALTLILIVGLIVMFVRRKHRISSIEDLEAIEDIANISFNTTEEHAAEKKTTTKEHQAVVTAEVPSSAAVDDTITDNNPSETVNHSVEVDDSSTILDEVDVYVSYGRNERAISLLETELLNHPERSHWRLKLLDLLSEAGNKNDFEGHYQMLQTTSDDQELLLNAEQFKQRLESTDDHQDDEALSLDVSEADSDLHTSLDVDESSTESLSKPSTTDNAIDFDMEFDYNNDALSADTANNNDVTQSEEPATPSETDAAELEFFTEEDTLSAKLNLAKAYVDMGDQDSAFIELQQVLTSGDPEQKAEAQAMLNALNPEDA